MISSAFLNTRHASGFVTPTPAGLFISRQWKRSIIEPTPPFRAPQVNHRRRVIVRAQADQNNQPPADPPKELLKPPKKPEQTFFGFRLRTNGDVIKFGIVATIIPFAIKAGLEATGVEDIKAGQLTTAFVSVFALVAWVSTYVFRVGTKQMTYAQQLRDYENQVIQKRYEELSDEELNALTEELTDES